MQDLSPPYLLFLGDCADRRGAKCASALATWQPDRCVGQLRLPRCAADAGLPDMTIADAMNDGVRTLVIGAPPREPPPDEWRQILVEALDYGLDIAWTPSWPVALCPDIVAASDRSGSLIHEIAAAPPAFAAPADAPAGPRLLTIGTDRAVGKLTAALSLERAFRAQGAAARFRATDPAGMLASGAGVPVGGTVADRAAGAADRLCADAGPGEWSIVQGLGSLYDPATSATSLALLHGVQPEALVLCHAPDRRHLRGRPDRPTPYLTDAIALIERMAGIGRPGARIVGIALDTAQLDPREARLAIERTEAAYGVPAGDPMRDGLKPMAAAILERFSR